MSTAFPTQVASFLGYTKTMITVVRSFIELVLPFVIVLSISADRLLFDWSQSHVTASHSVLPRGRNYDPPARSTGGMASSDGTVASTASIPPSIAADFHSWDIGTYTCFL